MTELKEEHFEVIDANRAKDHEKKNYKPLSYDLFIEESLIEGQGLFSSIDIPKGTDLGVSHIEFEKDKMSPKELIRTPLGGFINHEPTIKELQNDKLVEISGPNCEKIKKRPDGNKTEWNLVTLKDIKMGDELTLEYSFYKPNE
jgi:SET domain-containing protein|tara:strand:- start:306 stop:737 length:432 start_codon:yes stop_codon:yes gene_type:complete